MPSQTPWTEEVRRVGVWRRGRLRGTRPVLHRDADTDVLSHRQEETKLRELVDEHGPKKWSLIALKLITKGSKQVCVWKIRSRSLQAPWHAAVPSHTHTCPLPLPSLSQCRRRWKTYLIADLKKGGWSKEVRDCLGCAGQDGVDMGGDNAVQPTCWRAPEMHATEIQLHAVQEVSSMSGSAACLHYMHSR